MREVGRRREFEDELPAWRIPAFELLERIADVAAEDTGPSSVSTTTI
jgi:hypothetical protein